MAKHAYCSNVIKTASVKSKLSLIAVGELQPISASEASSGGLLCAYARAFFNASQVIGADRLSLDTELGH